MMKFSPALSAAVAVSVTAAAIWGGWQLLHPSESQTTTDRNAEPFAWVDCKPRLLDGSPAVAVMFTQPLARSQDWGKLAKATEGDKPETATPVPPRWVLGDNPRMLFLPNVTPDRTYRIALAEGVKATGGSTLGGAHECTVKSEAMPEAFYFASKGVVLPAGQNGGLPVVTVNTPEVDVQFLRVNADALPAFLEQVGGRPDARRTDNNTGNEGEGEYEGGWVDPARKLKGTRAGLPARRVACNCHQRVPASAFATDARKNRRNVSYLPVEQIKELQEPGIYVAVMKRPSGLWLRLPGDLLLRHRHRPACAPPCGPDWTCLPLRSKPAEAHQVGTELTLIDDNGQKSLARPAAMRRRPRGVQPLYRQGPGRVGSARQRDVGHCAARPGAGPVGIRRGRPPFAQPEAVCVRRARPVPAWRAVHRVGAGARCRWQTPAQRPARRPPPPSPWC
jgi:hypothetical protein